jgi:hypothetical protein
MFASTLSGRRGSRLSLLSNSGSTTAEVGSLLNKGRAIDKIQPHFAGALGLKRAGFSDGVPAIGCDRCA